MEDNRGILSFDDASIILKNFEGRASQYNREGDRNFGLVIRDPDLAQHMIDDGWNVKIRQPRTEDEDVFYWMSVKVKYGGKNPPFAAVVSQGVMQTLNEDTIACLDEMAIERINLDIRPYQWEVNGKTGISAYLQGIKVWQKFNRFAVEE